MNILFHGPSGCGKDTQSDLLVAKYDFQNIGTGEMFRKMYADGDLDGIRAYQYWSKGVFVPNDLVYKMLSRWLDEYDESKDWLFISVVRDNGQIPMFDNLLESRKKKLDYFVHFILDEQSAIERMSLRIKEGTSSSMLMSSKISQRMNLHLYFLKQESIS